MKTIQLVLMLFTLFVVASPTPGLAQDDICQNGACATCEAEVCVYGACYGLCTCNVSCKNGRCACGGLGVCPTSPDGTILCQNAVVKAATGARPSIAKQCGKKVDALTLKGYPWISSTTFIAQLVGHSSVRDLERLLGDIQIMIAEQGLADHLEIQTGTYIGEKPAVVRSAADVHLSELVGLTAALDPAHGSYVFKVYRDVAGPGGETKYTNVLRMVADGVAPVEVISVTGHSYEYLTADGKKEIGTF